MSTMIITNADLYDGTIGGHIPDAAIRMEDGIITHLGTKAAIGTWPKDENTKMVDAQGAPVVPGYIDIHHHGGGGVAYDDGPEATATALAAHRAHGTTRCVLSFVTDSLEKMEKRLADGATVTHNNPHVLGLHAEGPFLDPGHKGAHPEQELKDPTTDFVDRILAASNGELRQITIAPEKNNGLDAVKQLADAGVHVAVGHTNTDFDTAKEAFNRGARILTHTFNAMNGIHHRKPGPIIAALHDNRVWMEIINDGIHVHPDVVRLLFDEVPTRLVLVTDSMSATCCADGDYMLGQLEVTVQEGVARLTHGGSLAGSTLTMDVAVRNAVKSVGAPMDIAIACATTHPAAAIGMSHKYGKIAVGYPADVLILGKETLLPERIFSEGEEFEAAK